MKVPSAIVSVATSPVILVAEDEAKLRFIICELLSDEGYEVLEACDGAQALELFARRRPDMVVSDIRMPGIDGFELLAGVRRRAPWYDVPFVFLSARADQGDIRAGMLAGADDYLLKPFDPAQLVRIVRERLHRVEEVRSQMHEAQLQLIRRMPHELCTPLNGITGLTELLLLRTRDAIPPDLDELKEIAGLLKTSADRMQRLVENVLFWSEITVFRCETSAFDRAFSDGSEWVAALNLSCESIAREHGRVADVRIKVECAAVAVPSRRLIVVAGHLVENACKFSPAGTLVDVTVRLVGGQFQLRVSDAGRGMSNEEISQIGAFRQFRRDTHEQQGLGLGLAIVSAYAERYGGLLELSPVESGGPGLTAMLSLPIAQINPRCERCADRNVGESWPNCARQWSLANSPMAGA